MVGIEVSGRIDKKVNDFNRHVTKTSKVLGDDTMSSVMIFLSWICTSKLMGSVVDAEFSELQNTNGGGSAASAEKESPVIKKFLFSVFFC